MGFVFIWFYYSILFITFWKCKRIWKAFGEKVCSNNLVNKPQPLCCIHAIRTQAHANPCINSISFYFYFFPLQFLCQCLRVFGYSFVCWTWENTATHYYVYMIIMAVYIQHSEIVDPFYIESHRHQIEVKYNIIKPSSLCVLFFSFWLRK